MGKKDKANKTKITKKSLQKQIDEVNLSNAALQSQIDELNAAINREKIAAGDGYVKDGAKDE